MGFTPTPWLIGKFWTRTLNGASQNFPQLVLFSLLKRLLLFQESLNNLRCLEGLPDFPLLSTIRLKVREATTRHFQGIVEILWQKLKD